MFFESTLQKGSLEITFSIKVIFFAGIYIRGRGKKIIFAGIYFYGEGRKEIFAGHIFAVFRPYRKNLSL